MIIPISTDAPIYYWPWMTLVLIGANVVVFLATGFGTQSDGWQVSYGQGLHPLEWVAYNFFHYNWFHLIGNMFFLWGFGIVVEGKLGWWKYLLLYLGIGIVGGSIIQMMMLGFVDPYANANEQFERQLQQIQQQQPGQDPQQPAPARQATPVPQTETAPQEMNVSLLFAFVQQTSDAPQPAQTPAAPNGPPVPFVQPVVPNQPGQPPVMQQPGAPAGQFPNGDPEDDDMEFDAAVDAPEHIDIEQGGTEFFHKPGAAGASLVIYALLAIALVWAPKNEVTCLVLRVPPGTFEIEYIYFCGCRVVVQIIYAAVYGFQMSSAMGHAVGAVVGFAAGTLFLKQNWVDCENWDLFAVLKGTHGSRANIGGWRENVGHSITTPMDSGPPKKSKKKTTAFRASIYDAADSPKRSSAKTGSKSGSQKSRTEKSDEGEFELEGWDNFTDEAAEAPEALEILDDAETFDEPDPPPKKKSPGTTATPVSARATKSKETPAAPKKSEPTSPTDQIRAALQAGEVDKALKRYRQQKNASPNWKLGERELEELCDGLLKAQQWSDAVPLMEECLARFPQTSVRIRLKLAAIFAEVQRRPRAALKLLAQSPRDTLPKKLQAQYDKVRTLAQNLIDMNVEDRIR